MIEDNGYDHIENPRLSTILCDPRSLIEEASQVEWILRGYGEEWGCLLLSPAWGRFREEHWEEPTGHWA